MTKPNKNYLRIGFVISLLIVIATICEHANTESILRTANGILLGLIRSSIYIGLFAAWRFSVRQRIVPKNTRRYLWLSWDIAFGSLFLHWNCKA